MAPASMFWVTGLVVRLTITAKYQTAHKVHDKLANILEHCAIKEKSLVGGAKTEIKDDVETAGEWKHNSMIF